MPAMSSRRRFLQIVSSGVSAAVCSHLAAPRWASASDLSLSDRIDLLYSNQFHFNRRGEPQITVGLVQGAARVRLSSAAGLVVLPSGDGGTRIAGGTSFDIEIRRAKAAEQSYSIVLSQVASADARRVEAEAERWRERGLSPTEYEVGTVFGVEGRVLDTRRVLLAVGRTSSEEDALAEAARLDKAHGALGHLHPIVRRRATGGLVARDAAADLTVEADGVLWFSAADGGPITVHDVPGEGKGAETRTYRGSMYVAIDRHGKLSVVNLVSETELLSGLVPAEIYASAPRAALQAQAVAARGQLVAKVGTRHLDDPFLLCSEQHCQVYAGQGREHPRTNEAVRSTAGWVAMRPGGDKLVDTVYSANSGGFTEDNDNVWPSPADPQLRGRPDPLLSAKFRDGIDARNIEAWLASAPESHSRPVGESGRASYRWTETIDPAALDGNPGIPAGLGRVRRFVVKARGKSGRATLVRVEGSGKSVELAGELRIRRALGGLKSSMFVVDEARDRHGRIVLRGGGHGHGVGLCQHGAMGMAAAGKTYESILHHYYRDCDVAKLW